MFNNPKMFVTVGGGSNEENAQLVSAIHQSLFNNGFTNVETQPGFDAATTPMLAQIRLINPELFDTKILVGTGMVGAAPVSVQPASSIFGLPVLNMGFVQGNPFF